jgi:hypothetical protein
MLCFAFGPPRIYASRLRRLALQGVEAGSNTTTVALRVVKGDEKGSQCLGIWLGHPVPGGYKYGDLALQVGGVSNPRQ